MRLEKQHRVEAIPLTVHHAASIKPAYQHRGDVIRDRESRGTPYPRSVDEMIVYHRASTTVCILASLLLCLTSCTLGEYESREMSNGESSESRLPGNNFGSCTDGKCMKRTTQEITGGMWFGPRLGRRRRSGERPELSPEIEASALDGTHWTLVKIPANDKRQPTQFTPRLGRGSSEDLFSYGDAMDRSEENERPLPPLFAPRLGRRLPWAPSPRLGRQLRNALRKM
ncbi:PBAN-type neuropeptides-like [Odontomachus brunneus]|uniref:PBAN-type neuropeptides-like n=1 Tax=Odontomachus brunneus TaxID=486640 RepID=UPI0013F26BD7|nr:PBAN-type neuropeptides-like [Odontomachus brunneus]